MKCDRKVLIYCPCKNQHPIMIWRCCSRSWMLWEVCSKRMGTLTHKDEWFAGIFLLTTFHGKTFKLARVLRTASHVLPGQYTRSEIGCQWGWHRRRWGSKKSKLDNMLWEKLRDEIYEAWWIKHNLCVRAPWLARQGVHSMKLTYFIRTPKNSR